MMWGERSGIVDGREWYCEEEELVPQEENEDVNGRNILLL